MARPKVDIDPDQVVRMAAMGCKASEIAAVFDVSHKTISKRFSKEMAKGQEMGRSKLRRLMWQSAEKGNVVMLIWLSKNLLGYADKQEISTPEDAPKLVLAYAVEKKPKA